MTALLVNDILLSDKNKTRQMGTDHFETLGTTSVNDNFDNNFCANIVNRVREAFDFGMNDLFGDLCISHLRMKKLSLSVLLSKQVFLVSKLITSIFILPIHPYGNSCFSYTKIFYESFVL